MKSIVLSSLFIVLFLFIEGEGKCTDPPHNPKHSSGGFAFIENKGQLPQEVLFHADILNGNHLYFRKNSLVFNFWDLRDLHDRYFVDLPDRSHNVPVGGHVVTVTLLNANPGSIIIPNKLRKEYYNYFKGKDPSRWVGKVPLFDEINITEIYQGISCLFYKDQGSLKYDFLVQTGTSPNNIRLQYQGQENISIVDGNLLIKTSFMTYEEKAPYVYQFVDGEKKEVKCEYVLKGNVLSFGFPEGYDQSSTLIIDPNLIFSTYTGSGSDNFGFSATYDNYGNLYAGGNCFGPDYIVTPGVIQAGFGGGSFDISISKISSDGTSLLYGTYLGGSGNDQPHSMITDKFGNLFVYGLSYSTDFPVNGYDQTFNGGADIIVAKFSPNGDVLIGSTFLGGSANDGVNITNAFNPNSLKYNYGDDARGEIMIDSLHNVYIASCSQSGDYPLVAPIQPSLGGAQDAVVSKLDSNLQTLIWSTYYGGTDQDAAYSIKIADDNSAFVCGGTESADFPMVSGGLNPQHTGGIDGFVLKINSAGSSVVNSTFIGTPQYDQSYFLELGPQGNVFLFGQTLGSYPVSPGVYFNAGGKQFIHSLSQDLSTSLFSTVFGKGETTIDISPTAFLVDVCGFIYISGWGGATNAFFGGGNVNGMPITSDALFPQSDATGSDLYLMVLQQGAKNLVYSTFMGGEFSNEHVDGGTSRFNRNLEIYQSVCAGCGGFSDFPFAPDPGGISAENNSSNCNLACFKFAFDPHEIKADFQDSIIAGCSPFIVSFENTSTGGQEPYWNLGDGTISIEQNPTHLYTQPDTYEVSLVIIDSLSCNISDSLKKTVIIYPAPVATVSADTNSCMGVPVPLEASGGMGEFSYIWHPVSGLSDPFSAGPIASPDQTTLYQVEITNPHGCKDTAEVNVGISAYSANVPPEISFCEGSSGATLEVQSLGGTAPYYYTWWCDNSNPNCGIDSIFDNDPTVLPAVEGYYYVQLTDWVGCKSFVDSILVTPIPRPIVDAGEDVELCELPAPGTLLHATIFNESESPGPYLYEWFPSHGLSNPHIQDPYCRPDSFTIYQVVVSSLSTGCNSYTTGIDELATIVVTVNPSPDVNVEPELEMCFGDTLMLTGFGSGTGPEYQYEWSPYTSLSDPYMPNPLAFPDFTTTYILSVFSNGCMASDTLKLNVHTQPTTTANPPLEICFGDSLPLFGLSDGDSTSYEYTYHWLPAAGLEDPSNLSSMASPEVSTVYFLTGISVYGCSSLIDSQLVVVLPSPVSEAGPDRFLCVGDSVQLKGAIDYGLTNGGMGNDLLLIQWLGEEGLSNVNEIRPFAFPDSTIIYYLTLTHGECRYIDSTTVFVDNLPEVSIIIDSSRICEGQDYSCKLEGNLVGTSIEWYPTELFTDPSTTPTSFYSVKDQDYGVVLSEGACSDSLMFSVQVYPSPHAEFIVSDTVICENELVQFLNLSLQAVGLQWDFGDGNILNGSSNPSHNYLLPGDYKVRLLVKSEGGCSDEMSKSIHISQNPDATFSVPEDTLWLPNSFLSPVPTSEEDGFFWDFGDGNYEVGIFPEHQYSAEGEYLIHLFKENESGCRNSFSWGPIFVKSPVLTIPNVFSPNNDGVNDVFSVSYSGTEEFSIKVFDRWGGEIYSANNPKNSWNGSFEGKIAFSGIYYYSITVGKKVYTGHISLLR